MTRVQLEARYAAAADVSKVSAVFACIFKLRHATNGCGTGDLWARHALLYLVKRIWRLLNQDYRLTTVLHHFRDDGRC